MRHKRKHSSALETDWVRCIRISRLLTAEEKKLWDEARYKAKELPFIRHGEIVAAFMTLVRKPHLKDWIRSQPSGSCCNLLSKIEALDGDVLIHLDV